MGDYLTGLLCDIAWIILVVLLRLLLVVVFLPIIAYCFGLPTTSTTIYVLYVEDTGIYDGI